MIKYIFNNLILVNIRISLFEILDQFNHSSFEICEFSPFN